MAVRIRMKQMGRAHRPFYRICAIDKRAPRDGKVLEELGTYDPMIADTDARARLNSERIQYWIGVGAQPSEKVAVLIKKYTEGGTHYDAHLAALEKLGQPKVVPDAGEPVLSATPEPEPAAEEATEGGEAPAEQAPAEESAGEEAPAEGGDEAETKSE